MARISDPAALRALAHPLRIRLLEALAARGTSSATELADLVDESPSNCSFHLRKLAEHGYIERADDAAGREKPWRLIDPSQQLDPNQSDPAAVAAFGAASSAFREWDFARIRTAGGRRTPQEWSRTESSLGATLFLTPHEARELSDAIVALVEPYVPRTADPAERPEGVGAFRLYAAMTYLEEYQAQLDGRPSGGAAPEAESASSGDEQ